MTETAHTTTGLERELLDLPRQIQEAAADGDKERWEALRMRLDALPEYIRRQRLEPLRAQLDRLEEELDGLVEQRQRAMTEDPPSAPASMHGTITVHMRRQRILDGVAARERQASDERRKLRARISEIEAGC